MAICADSLYLNTLNNILYVSEVRNFETKTINVKLTCDLVSLTRSWNSENQNTRSK